MTSLKPLYALTKECLNAVDGLKFDFEDDKENFITSVCIFS